jgi:hypothetical protein
MARRISAAEARRIAADWHGGQWSALYMFASAGVLHDGRWDRNDVLAEIRACRMLLNTDAYTEAERSEEDARLTALEWHVGKARERP